MVLQGISLDENVEIKKTQEQEREERQHNV